MLVGDQPIPSHCYKDNTDYDTKLHFLGVAALLIVSVLGTTIPHYITVHLSKKVIYFNKASKINSQTFQIDRHWNNYIDSVYSFINERCDLIEG
jgi:hypothetical protein